MNAPSDLSIVLFDGECPLCCTLAGLMERRADGTLTFASWQSFASGPSGTSLARELRERPANALRFWDGHELHDGHEAWQRLIEQCRDLKGLGWLAAKLGLTREVAGVVMTAASVIKRFCVRCGKRV